ncbi:hypothetical protein AAU61_02820 [Desulfocarbo indianensis]|nr:hypothetical protein AAU61_02820 [Desulfocarbo indianensis]
MIKKVFIIPALIAVLWVALVYTAHAETRVYVHFFVVPIPSQDGTKDEMAALRRKLIELAGGYTELGMAQGGSQEEDGSLETSYSMAFIVSASRNITADLEEYVPLHFPVQKPFILVWQAGLNQ